MSYRWIVLAAAFLIACDGSGPVEKPVEKPVAVPSEAPAAEPAKAPAKLSKAELDAQAENVTLVPSPAEMQRALEKAGLTSRLSEMVTERTRTTDAESLDQVAVRTGVVLAEVVLTVKETPKQRFAERMGALKQGFHRLQAGADIPKVIDDLVERVNNDAISRDDLLKEVDELSGVMVPELETEVGDWVVPLIQAGSWLQGSHLVSGAIQNEGKVEEASGMLRQPQVVNYFLSYVQREGREKAPDQVVQQLEQTLLKLKTIAGKDLLNAQDINDVHEATGAVLTLL